MVCLILALCVFVSYFGISAIFIDALAMLAKGLIGYGYWVLGPALVLTAFILLFHHGRPVTLRVISAMLLPVLLGSLVHMLRVKEAYASSIGIIPALWKDGIALQCGGVLSGVLAQGFVAVFSKIASIIIFTVLLVMLTMVALRLTVGALIEKHRERPRYEAEPEEPIQTGKRTRKPEPAIPAESSRARIDIPVDDPVDAPAPKPEKTGFTGFFRHRSEQQKTPAQIVAAQKAAAEESEPYEDGDPFAVKAPGSAGDAAEAHSGQGGTGTATRHSHYGAGGALPAGGACGGCTADDCIACSFSFRQRSGCGGTGAAVQKGGGTGRSSGDCRRDRGDCGEYDRERNGVPLSAGEPAAGKSRRKPHCGRSGTAEQFPPAGGDFVQLRRGRQGGRCDSRPLGHAV